MNAPELRRTWLVQRLKKPIGSGHLAAMVGALSFGGGRRNGGVSDEAMGLLRQHLSFDYMGAAEFEWGAVPEALSTLAKAKRLAAFHIDIPLAAVAANWRERDKAAPDGSGRVFVLCPDSLRAQVDERVRELAAGSVRTMESVRLSDALRPVHEWDTECCGWLELDNGFMFFTDEDMWRGVCELFAVQAVTA